jgi:hypothetical protein
MSKVWFNTGSSRGFGREAEVRRIISYGVAAMLVANDMREWLQQVLR